LSRRAADRGKKIKTFEPPPPIINNRSRRAAERRKKILNFEQPPPTKSSAYTSTWETLKQEGNGGFPGF
jgi:hypothetical protein